jgi:hypothetical protein
MSDRTKKILLIIALIVITFILAFILYLFATNRTIPGLSFGTPNPGTSTTIQLPGSQTRTTTPGNSGQTGGPGQTLPGSSSSPSQPGSYYQPQSVTRLNADAVGFPSGNSTTGGYRYYNIGDGKFYRIGSNGTVQQLSDQVFFNVSKVTWSATQDKAVLEYPDQTKIVYNFDTKKQVTLPSFWQDFSFSPDGSELVAKSLGLSAQNHVLVVTKDDGTGEQAIQELGDNADKVTVNWSPSRQTVAFSQTGNPAGGEQRQILLIGMHQENFKPITVEGLNFLPEWSPSGQRLLYSVDNSRTDYKPELWITNSYGDNIDAHRKELQINTWADKCSFTDENTLYCAVPRDLPEGVGMLREAATAPDDIYRIDLKTGAKVPISLDGQDHRVSSLKYDKTSNKLFFTDQNELGVFEVKL